MTAKDFRIGDLVWAKMKGFPSWPARVSEPKKAPKKFHHYVYFFGTKDYAWILDEHITAHSEGMLTSLSNKKMTATLKAAVEEIAEAAKEVVPMDEDERNDVKEDEGANAPSIKTKLTMKYKKLKESKKQFKAPKKRFFGSRHPPSSKQRKPKAVISPYDDDPLLDDDLKPSSAVSHVPPTDKKIGFIGLGMMGQHIARCLLKSGHKVTVWNRSQDKCDDFVKAGALKAATPADVIAACDITFCCLADAEASKLVVFSQAGVLRGLEVARRSPGGLKKGYVELTSLDEQTSQEIAEAVQFEGGRYLEAQLGFSTRQMAQEGDLVALVSGNEELFRECETCFHAISRRAYFVGEVVGQGSKISLITSALAGSTSAAIGEALALADRIGVAKKDILDVARVVGFSCPLLEDKVLWDHHLRPPPTVSLKNQQKDLFHAMRLSDAVDQPMPVTAAANELYKHAKRLGYQNRDASAVYLATKF